MLNRRDFLKRLISAGVVLGSTSFDPFSIALNCPTAGAESKRHLPIPGPQIRVIGLGGSGGRAVNYLIRSGFDRVPFMMRSGYGNVEFILADRDPRFMNSSKIERLIPLETDLSELEISPDERLPPTLIHDKEKILQAVKGSHLVFIIAGLGGETGTFWAPLIAEICTTSGILTVALITKPLFFEPFRSRRWAEESIEKLCILADTVVPVYLDNYGFLLSPESDFKEVYDLGYKEILGAVKGITDLILLPGLIGFDLEDLRSILCRKGLAAFQFGIAEGKDRAQKAFQMAVEGLLDQGIRIRDSQSVVVNFTAGFKSLGFEEITQASDLVQKETKDQADILWGVVPDDTITENFKATVFAIGGEYKKPHWAKNIFCQVENKELSIELEMLAREMNCTIRRGEPFTPDILATPYFISIVDRNLIGEEYWNLFLQFCRETKDDTPLIIVDELPHLELPDHKNILLVDLKNPQAIGEIKSAIRKIGS
jgi:cell division protein FtsZ